MSHLFPHSNDNKKTVILKVIRLVCLFPFILSIIFLFICPFLYSKPNQGMLDFGALWTGPVVLALLLFEGSGGGYIYGIYIPDIPLWPIFVLAIFGAIFCSVCIGRERK